MANNDDNLTPAFSTLKQTTQNSSCKRSQHMYQLSKLILTCSTTMWVVLTAVLWLWSPDLSHVAPTLSSPKNGGIPPEYTLWWLPVVLHGDRKTAGNQSTVQSCLLCIYIYYHNNLVITHSLSLLSPLLSRGALCLPHSWLGILEMT